MRYSIFNDFTPEELQTLLDTSNSLAHVLKRLKLSPSGGNYATLNSFIKEYNLNLTQINKNRSDLYRKCSAELHIKKAINLQDIFEGKIVYKSSYNLLQKIFKEGYKERKCEICGITEWMGKPISFHLHHKDGNHENNSFDNLQVLCPNCHSQTENYTGKKLKKKKKKTLRERKDNSLKIKKDLNISSNKDIKTTKKAKILPISREDLKYRIYNEPFLSIAREYGVSDNAIRKWCDRYGLPRKKTVIQTISPEEWEKI